MNSLNINGQEFCKRIGITYHGDILMNLRDLDLVGFFKIGKKYMYPVEDTQKVSTMLRSNKISIKTDNGSYYITLNQ